MKFCSSCGSPNQKTFIDGNNRFNCTVCGTIHYENPKPTTSLICIKNDKLLLGRRAFNPAKGEWGLIGGFMELNENLYESAKRELMEETNLIGNPIKIIIARQIVSIDEISINLTRPYHLKPSL